MKLLIYTIDKKPQAVDQRNKSSKVASLRGVAILAITSKHSNNAATPVSNALQFTPQKKKATSKSNHSHLDLNNPGCQTA